MSSHVHLSNIIITPTKKLTIKCTSCNGTGRQETIGPIEYEPCHYCLGTGRNTKSNCWAQPCGYCKGSKKQIKPPKKVLCYVCNGKKVLEI